MSLVNDVLRELNSPEKPNKALPLHPLVADEPVRKKQIVGMLFPIVIGFLLLVLLLQTFYKESIFDIFMTAKSPELQQEVIAASNAADKAELRTTDKAELRTTDQTVSKESKNIEKESSEVKNNEQAVAKPLVNKAVKQMQTEVQEPVKASEFQPVKIKTIENPGFKEYQLALRSYKNKQNKSALAWIDLAIIERKKSEYLRLKIRILSQLGNSEELRKFVLANKDHTDIEWFELVAPSLQMHGFYELSNNYYAELVMQQPNEVKWRLAMALNYSKLGLNKQTYSIYKNLLESNLLTNKQKQWIASRLERMDQGGGVSSGS